VAQRPTRPRPPRPPRARARRRSPSAAPGTHPVAPARAAARLSAPDANLAQFAAVSVLARRPAPSPPILPPMQPDEQPLTPERLEIFLAELRKHGVVARAARAASPHAKGSCVGPFFGERERNPAFRQSWDEALLEAAGNAEHELYRRAQESTDKPVFQRG